MRQLRYDERPGRTFPFTNAMKHLRASLLIVTAFAATAACGGSDQGPPLATPSLSMSASRAPLGAPIEMTYRFHVAPDAAFGQDFRVMVHFVDVDDELMWTDDHDPPTPTSQWRPGQTIEYSRTFFLPVYPYLGQATVQVGLYDAASQRRVTLAGSDSGQRAYPVGTIELLPESEAIFVVYGEGWHVPEVSQQNLTEEWRWTDQSATVSFRNPKRDARVYLELDGRPDLFDGQQTVSLAISGQVVDTLTLTTVDRVLHTVPVTADALGGDDIVHLTIAVDRAFAPAEMGERDTRRLGVRVFHLYIE